nr:endonuclease III [Helicobacter sp. MIT 03-1614]
MATQKVIKKSVSKSKDFKKHNKREIEIIKSRFLEHYGDAKTELVYHNIYELLVCVMLSAQCTDKRVNLVTPALFKAYPNVATLSQAHLEDVKILIQSVSFFNNKAKHLITMANQVMNDFNGEIPTTQAELKTLAGVGQKTANVVLIEFFEQNYMAVDTHVFRVSHRLGLSGAKSALETEKELTQVFKTQLSTLHQAFVLFGRYTCKALKPMCENCFVGEFCQKKCNFKPA